MKLFQILLIFSLLSMRILSSMGAMTTVEQGNMEYPFLGVSYKIDNPPYGPVTLVPYIEPENAPMGTTVKSNVIIASNSSDASSMSSGGVTSTSSGSSTGSLFRKKII